MSKQTEAVKDFISEQAADMSKERYAEFLRDLASDIEMMAMAAEEDLD